MAGGIRTQPGGWVISPWAGIEVAPYDRPADTLGICGTMSTSRATRRAAWRTPRGAIIAIVAASAVAAMFSGASPTGSTIGDAFWNGVAGATLARATVDARRWSWFPMAGVAASVAQGALALLCGIGALAGVFTAGFFAARRRWIGAVVGALAAQALLRGWSYGFTGLPTIVAIGACLPLLISAYLNASAKTKRVAWVGTAVLAIVVTVLSIFTAVSAVRARDRVEQAIDFGNDALEAAESGDQVLAAGLITASAEELDSVATDFSRPWLLPARFVPILGPHATVLHTVADAGSNVAGDAGDVLANLDPDSIVAGGGRIEVGAVQELVGPMNRLRVSLDNALDDVADVDTTWLANPAEERVIELIDELSELAATVDVADDLVSVAPQMLGANEPRRYLVVFLTPSEMRGAGGFIGNWAEVVFDRGALDLVATGRSNDVNDALPPGGVQVPNSVRSLYLGFELEATFQNLTVTPDFPTVANLVRTPFERAFGRQLDGVIGLDASGMASVVQLTGPVEVDGQQFNADQLREFVLRGQYTQYGDDNERRLEVLEELTNNTFEALVEADLPSPQRMVEIFEPVVEGNHMRVVSFDNSENVALEAAELGDPFPLSAGQDLLAVVTQNLGENKIDIFLQRQLDYDVTIDPDTGRVQSMLTVTLINNAPADGLPQAIIGNNDQGLPPGTNRLRVQVYSPLDVTRVVLNGLESEMIVEEELGWKRYRTDQTLDPGQTEVLEMHFDGFLDIRNGYVLGLEHQPLTNPDQVNLTVRVEGQEKLGEVIGLGPDGRASVTLTSDQVIGLLLG